MARKILFLSHTIPENMNPMTFSAFIHALALFAIFFGRFENLGYSFQCAPGLKECWNAVIVPHIASASLYTRGGMATLAAANVAARLQGHSVWHSPNNATPFLEGGPPPPQFLAAFALFARTGEMYLFSYWRPHILRVF